LRDTPRITNGKWKRYQILFVDDDEDIVKVLSKGLEHEGFDVDRYTSSEQALASFRPGKYDLAIRDIRMPGLNGFSLCRRLKEMDPTISACFLSAFEIHPDEFKKVFPSIGSNIATIIKKPTTIRNLVRKITPILDMTSSARTIAEEQLNHSPAMESEVQHDHWKD
jgi:DNA-binding response OmpR family regulator